MMNLEQYDEMAEGIKEMGTNPGLVAAVLLVGRVLVELNINLIPNLNEIRRIMIQRRG